MNTTDDNLFGKNMLDLKSLENYLDETLQPYRPSAAFVGSLHTKLVRSRSKNSNRTKLFKYGIFGTAGVLSGVILVATSIRAVVTIFGAVRMLRKPNLGVQ